MRACLDRFMLLLLSVAITGHDWFLLRIVIFTDSGCSSNPFPSASLLTGIQHGFVVTDISAKYTYFFCAKLQICVNVICEELKGSNLEQRIFII